MKKMKIFAARFIVEAADLVPSVRYINGGVNKNMAISALNIVARNITVCENKNGY